MQTEKMRQLTVDLNVPVHHILWNTELIFPAENMQFNSMFGLETKNRANKIILNCLTEFFPFRKSQVVTIYQAIISNLIGLHFILTTKQ